MPKQGACEEAPPRSIGFDRPLKPIETIGCRTPLADLSALIDWGIDSHKSRSLNAKLVGKCEFFSPGMSIYDRVIVKLLKGKVNSETIHVVATINRVEELDERVVSMAMVCAMMGLKCRIVFCDADEHICLENDPVKENIVEGVKIFGGEIEMEHGSENMEVDSVSIHSEECVPAESGKIDIDLSDHSLEFLNCMRATVEDILSDLTVELHAGEKQIILVVSEHFHQMFCSKSNPNSHITIISRNVSMRQTIDTCKEASKRIGLMVGSLSGANIAAALEVISSTEWGTPNIILVATILPDVGLRYMSTIFNPSWAVQFEPKIFPIGAKARLSKTTFAFVVDKRNEEQKNDHDRDSAIEFENGSKFSSDRAKPISSLRKHTNAKNLGNSAAESLCDMVGETPLLDFSHLVRNVNGHKNIKVYAKCEFFNPSFSVKDRIMRNILEKAEKEGRLKSGMTIVAASSGNTGASCAMFAAVKGYSCIITTSPKCSKEKMDAIKAYGAKLLVSPSGVSEDHPNHYMNLAATLADGDKEKYFDVNQYSNLDNPEGHYLSLGPEIYAQSNGKITTFVCGASTGGTISGTSKYLKDMNKSIRCVLADPTGSILYDCHAGTSTNAETCGNVLVEGVGKGSVPGCMNMQLVDAALQILDVDTFKTCDFLAKGCGILAGGSSGLNVYAALKLANESNNPNEVVVTLLPDCGIKYQSKIYNNTWLEKNGVNIRN